MIGTGRRRVYLMRHGHVDYFAPGVTDPRVVRLTDAGREQAGAARDALAGIHFDIAVHSGLPRTIETAGIVLEGRGGIAAAPEPGLEELKSGWLNASSREELAARLAFCFDEAGSPGARFLPDGESFADAETRITDAMERLIVSALWKTALIVAHEGVNRIILGWASGGGLKTIGAFEQDLACINVIDLDVTARELTPGLKIERAILKSVNVTPYDFVKAGLPRTSLEHLFEVDFGRGRPDKDWPGDRTGAKNVT
ncbi:MAG: histidine phosphatase family protein [Parvularculaceae bacterium]